MAAEGGHVDDEAVVGLGLAVEGVGLPSGGDLEGGRREGIKEERDDAGDVGDRVRVEDGQRREVVHVAEVSGSFHKGRLGEYEAVQGEGLEGGQDVSVRQGYHSICAVGGGRGKARVASLNFKEWEEICEEDQEFKGGHIA